jgi:hypothetical protein
MIKLPDQIKGLFLLLLLVGFTVLPVIIVTVRINIEPFEQPCRAKTSGIPVNETVLA